MDAPTTPAARNREIKDAERPEKDLYVIGFRNHEGEASQFKFTMPSDASPSDVSARIRRECAAWGKARETLALPITEADPDTLTIDRIEVVRKTRSVVRYGAGAPLSGMEDGLAGLLVATGAVDLDAEMSLASAWKARYQPIAVEGDRALVMHRKADRTEYIVAHGYDEESGHWAHGTYYTSIAPAAADFEGRAISSRADVFHADFWCDADIEAIIEDRTELEPTPEFVVRVKDDLGRFFSDRLSEEGQEMILDAVEGAALELERDSHRHGAPKAPSTDKIKVALASRTGNQPDRPSSSQSIGQKAGR